MVKNYDPKSFDVKLPRTLLAFECDNSDREFEIGVVNITVSHRREAHDELPWYINYTLIGPDGQKGSSDTLQLFDCERYDVSRKHFLSGIVALEDDLKVRSEAQNEYDFLSNSEI